MRRLTILVVVSILTASGCSPSESAESGEATTTTVAETTTTAESTTTTIRPDFSLTSPAFDEGEPIPVENTCDGDDISPRLDIVGLPEGTHSVVIIVDDPDAPLGTWNHWTEFDIPVLSHELVIDRGTEMLGVPGVNSWNVTGYLGPCPPEGEEHTYEFTVYAMGGMLDLPEGVGRDAVLSAIEGHVLDSRTLTGTYSR